MIFKYIKSNLSVTDAEFNEMYPEKIKALSERHWTPIEVAKESAKFLAEEPGTNVLDIGSGAGKFCMIGSAYTAGHFTGIEQRGYLVKLANELSKRYHLENVRFIHGNITDIDFGDYDAFYFFNSFYENIAFGDKIDNSVTTSMKLYHTYSMHLFEQFCCLPRGTRLVTYHCTSKIIPSTFQLLFTAKNGLLKFWEKHQ